MVRRQAFLLVGPTGSGKTPLGEWLQTHGLRDRCCHHFDFGANLRGVASGHAAGGFTPDEVHYIQDVVEKGALLENETFYLALRILEAFLESRRVQMPDLLIMNGLPRHAGQAAGLVPYIDFVAVIQLRCSAQTIWERLWRNSGGDRTHRTDDAVALVERKMAIYAERTEPLLAWYHERGVPLFPISVGVDTHPSEIVALLQQ